MSVMTPYFDRLFAENDDPWAFRQRWYERRKRSLTLAVLPQPHYRSIFEPGCANGELSAGLALRCDHLVCCDTSAAAVVLAQARLKDFAHAEVRHSRLPQQWPTQSFELIVLSELCYYLDHDDLCVLIDCALASLPPDGQVLACHWRPDIEGCPQTGQQVHERLHERLKMPRLVHHHESDLLLDLWCHDDTSIASREGLR
ncbi:methyltransferase domain-containing protein [Pseudomonas sp. CCM 7891]|uniref:Methyltransferase domain-containing protein n=1 Tax=Pseudomonas karstica TaxID=1055468 RepID=A0A7X2RNG3_9PSED|nr:SAM-dependent methyltransferase [Pseudomonas karstica]MTD18167.1 methyltransferase domain-containing protein [Pseudomonas karstica]